MDACTLPLAERPLRIAEFDDLFAEAVHRVETISPTQVRMHFTGSSSRVRELADREAECCSFFRFTVSRTTLDIEVPPAHTDVLVALAARARGMRTGEVAERAGVNVQTLRYYERRGLLREPARSTGGHRLYPPATVALVGTIKAAQRLGFTLDEISDLLDARRRPQLRDRAAAKLDEIDARIADLTAVRAALAEVVDAQCDSLTNCSCGNCPI
jgi:DNA-binding transcriptional MerR regulator